MEFRVVGKDFREIEFKFLKGEKEKSEKFFIDLWDLEK